MADWIIRRETPEDYAAVENVIREAFWNLYVPGCDEHYIAHVLRGHEDFIPELDLVAEAEGRILGSVMYTKAWLKDESGSEKEILTFGPIGILPGFQRRGIGKALLERSFEIARGMGYDAIVIFGHPGNYVSRGFISCKKANVSLPDGTFPTAMLAKALTEDAFDGRRWFYRDSPAFEINPDQAQAFDRQFPQKEKKTQPSQEEFYIYSHSVVKG